MAEPRGGIKANPFECFDPDDTKNAFQNLLQNMESGGTLATSGIYTEAPLPGLTVTQFGDIPLPLTGHDACAIIKHQAENDEDSSSSTKAPRDQRMIDADQMKINNVAWDEFVGKVADRASEELGLETEHTFLGLRLRGMHLCQKNAWVDSQKFDPVDKDVVGRLSICLPSKHSGGDLHANYGGKTKKFPTGPYSTFSYSYIAWYAGITYEINAVHSGYRLTLEYDLVQKSAENTGSIESLYAQKSKLRDLIMAWTNNVKKDTSTDESRYPTLLVYVCDFELANEALNFGALQGQDRLRADCLEDLGRETGMSLYLARLKRTRSGYCYYRNAGHQHIDEEEEDSIVLTYLVNSDGRHVAREISISENENFVESGLFDNGPDEEDFDSDYGGVAQYYKMTVLVMIPDVSKSEWLPEEEKETKKRKREVEVIDLE